MNSKKTNKSRNKPPAKTLINKEEDKYGMAKSDKAEMELKSSLSLLRATLESTADGILVVDSKGKLITYNQKFVEMWGIPDYVLESRDDQEALKYVLDQLKAPEDFIRKVEDLYKAPSRESYDVLEFKDGRILERYSQPQRIGRTIVGRVWSFRDVTDRKRAETKLEEREKRLLRQNQVLLELASSRTLEQGDLDQALKEVAKAAAQTLGVERVNIWLYDKDRSRVRCVEQYELSAERHSKGYELSAADYPAYFEALEEERIIAAHSAHTDPRTREFSDSYLTPHGITSLLDAPVRVGGRMVGLICHENVGPPRIWTLEEQHFAGSMADIISLDLEAWERKRAEQALRDSEERFRTLIEHSYDLIVEADVDGKFLYLSPNHRELLGYDPDELVGRDIFDNIHPDDRDAVIAEFGRVMRDFTSGHVSFRLRHKNGDWRWLESAGKPFISAKEEIRTVIASRDITERKMAEDALKDSLTQLSKKNRYETIISAVTRSVHQSLNLEDVLENAVDALSKNVEGAENVAIHMVEGTDAVIRAFRGYPDWYVKRIARIPYPKGVTWRTIMEGKPSYSGNARDDTVIGKAGIELGTKSYLSMPIQHEDKTVGVININSFQEDAFDQGELNLLAIVSQQIEVAINNARQAEALRQSEEALKESLDQLSKKNRYETIISTVTRSVHQSTNLQDVMDNAVEAISRNIDRADCVAIYIVEAEEAVLKAQRGYVDWYIDRVGRIPYPRGYAWKVIMDEKPRYSRDVDQDTVIGPAGRELGIKSYLSMPIRYEGKTIGVLNINSYQKDAFDEEELKVLEIVTEQITVALGNARQKGALQEALSEVESLKKRLESEFVYPRSDLRPEHGFNEIVGRSESLKKVLLKVEQVAPIDVCLLIVGETGTEKELLARAIHSISPRREKPFMKLDISRLGKEFIEGQLFGREEKGTYSGALSLSIGLIEKADGGTIYLEGIGQLPLDIQGKLLRVIQDGEFRRPGSSANMRVNVRVIAASDGDLEDAVSTGVFREDLYNELSGLRVLLPPLRERKEDIPDLVEHFLVEQSEKSGKKIETVPEAVLNKLLIYEWPGNVEELKDVVVRSVALTTGSTLELDEQFAV